MNKLELNTEDYVSYETAKLLKEKGFDNDVICTDCWYDEDGDLHRRGNYSYSGAPVYHKDTCCNAPTLQMAMKWLRVVHGMYIAIVMHQDTDCDFNTPWIITYHYNVQRLDRLANEGGNCIIYDKYEQTCDEAIKYCLTELM